MGNHLVSWFNSRLGLQSQVHDRAWGAVLAAPPSARAATLAQDVKNGACCGGNHHGGRNPDPADQDPDRPVSARIASRRWRREAMLQQRFRPSQCRRRLFDFRECPCKLIILNGPGRHGRGDGRIGRGVLSVLTCEKECVCGISCRDSRAVASLATACHALFQSDVSAEFGWMVSLLDMSERYLRQLSPATFINP